MCQCQAVDGLAGAWHRMHYAKLAASGAGLVVVEATAVEPAGRITVRCLGLYNDAQQQAFAKLLAECRAVAPSAKLFIQLSHSGRKGSRCDPALGHRTLPAAEGGFEVVAPSAIRFNAASPVPAELSEADIGGLIAAFADAARRAAAAGFDGIQLHCAHGYLIHEFLSPVTNRRDDRWGGTLENRMRFALEIIRAVRAAVPGMPLMLRVSSGDFVPGGWTMDDALVLLERARELGVAAADASPGGLSPDQDVPDLTVADQARLARRIKEQTHLASWCVGRITEALQAEAILQEGSADGIGIGREMIRNPNWGWMAAQVLHASVAMPSAYWAAF